MVFDGAIGLRDLESQYNIELPEDPAYSTLGGFVLAQLGLIPKGGESFDYGGYRFTVVRWIAAAWPASTSSTWPSRRKFPRPRRQIPKRLPPQIPKRRTPQNPNRWPRRRRALRLPASRD